MGSQSSMLERPDGYDSDRSRSRSRSASPLPREDHILNKFSYDAAVDPDDGMDGLPRFDSTMQIVPRAQAESPEDRPRYASQPEPPGRTKEKKKKSKKRRSPSAMADNELELDEVEVRDTYREQAPSAEPIARAHAERNGGVDQDSSSKRKKDKRRSKTPRPQPDLPEEEEEATQPFSNNFYALSLSSQQDPNGTQLEDLQEGLVEMPSMRPSDAGSSRKKNRKDKRKSLEQIREATSELAADPISDNDETGDIPSSVRSFKKREPGIISAISHRKPKIPPPPESIEDFETFPSQTRSISPAQIIGDSQNDGPVAPRITELFNSTPNDNIKADREEETDSIIDDQSPAVARQQRRGRTGAQRLVVELGNKSVGRRGKAKAVPAEVDNEADAPESQQMGSEMDVDTDLGSGGNTLQTTDAREQEQDPDMAQKTNESEDESMQDIADEQETDAPNSGDRGELPRKEVAPESELTAESAAEETDQANGRDEENNGVSQGPVNGVADLDDRQIPSPTPTEDGPQLVAETARARNRTGRSKKTRDVYDQETQQSQENGGTQDLLESFPVISTPPASSAKTPKSQRGTRRKPKTPYFDRGEGEISDAFAALPPDDAVTTPKVKPPPSSDPPGEGASTSAPKPKPTKRSKKATPANDSDANTPDNDEDQKQGRKKMDKSQYRSGALTDAEQRAVCAAVEAIRANEGISQDKINAIIHENPKGLKESIHHRLWRAVVESCPSRPRQKLINWCRQRFHNFVARATWTKEQDEELMQMVRMHGTKWSLIGGLINRHQKDVRDRHRNYLVYHGKANSHTWSAEEEDKFYEAIERAVESIRDGLAMEAAEDKDVEELINWHQVSQAMNCSRTRLQCLEKWKRLRASDSLPNRITTKLPGGTSWRTARARKDLRRMTAEEKYVLVCLIRDSGANAEYRIPWKDIVTDVFDDKFQRQALVVAWGRLRETVPGWEEQTTAESAAHIAEMYEQDHSFLADDRTEASRSRATTVEAKTPSRRSPVKRSPVKRSQATPTPASQQRIRSNETIDPEDEVSDSGGEEGLLPNLGILRDTRTRGRPVSEEVEESVLGDVEERVNGDVEMADGDEAAETQGEEDIQPTNGVSPDHEREESVDLSFGVDDGDKTPRAAKEVDVDASLPMSPTKSKKSKKSKSKEKKKERRKDREPSEERVTVAPGSPTPSNTPLTTAYSAKKRRAELVNGTDQTPTISTPDTGESPTKRRRRTLTLKTYSSVRAREQKSKILGGINGRRKSRGSDIKNESGDEELETTRRTSSSMPLSQKRLSAAAGSPSLTQSQSLPPPSAQQDGETYSDLSSNMDDMEDIPAELPDHLRLRGTPLQNGFS